MLNLYRSTVKRYSFGKFSTTITVFNCTGNKNKPGLFACTTIFDWHKVIVTASVGWSKNNNNKETAIVSYRNGDFPSL